MSQYLSEFQEAIARTTRLGLMSPAVKIDCSTYLTSQAQSMFPYAIAEEVGILEPDDVVAKCFDIHLRIKPALEKLYGTDVYYTLGHVDTGDMVRFKQTEESLKYHLQNKFEPNAEFSLHAWLTLPSMEIIDIALPTSLAVVNGYKDGIGGAITEHADKLKKGLKYHPMLVGSDYLFKSGLIRFGFI